jgi:hypothetical protein
MKKIVRLTESDLVRLVKRVINEKRNMNEYEYFYYIPDWYGPNTMFNENDEKVKLSDYPEIEDAFKFFNNENVDIIKLNEDDRDMTLIRKVHTFIDDSNNISWPFFNENRIQKMWMEKYLKNGLILIKLKK